MLLFGMIILMLFAVIGLCAFITALVNASCRCEGEALLKLTNMTADNAEARIRSAARICQSHRGMRLLCECREDDPAYDICRLMQKEYPFMEIIPG